MQNQQEFIVSSTAKHIKPLSPNLCDSPKVLNDYKDLVIEIENLISDKGIDWIYLCHIINDNKQMIQGLTVKIQKALIYPINNIGQHINDNWENIIKLEDYYYLNFIFRKLPSILVRDDIWRIVSHRIQTAGKTMEDYPGIFTSLTRRYTTAKTKETSNYKSIVVYPIDQYNREFTKQEIFAVFSIFHKLEKYGLMLKLWCKLLIQQETVQIILHNLPLWILMKNLLNKPNVSRIMNYCLFYALFILDREEMISKKTTTDYRFVFNVDDLRQIPRIDDFNTNVNVNPWNTYLVGSQRPTYRAIFHLDGQRHITSKKEFHRRFDIATNRIFTNINLKKYGAIITGSILPPLVAYNPLEELFNKFRGDLTNVEFKNYLDYYYPTQTEIDKKSDLENLTISDIDVGMLCKTSSEFIKNCKDLYINIAKNNPETVLKECATTSFFKYQIIVPDGRNIDLFPVMNKTGIDLVKRFHLGCVRMYWDGNNLYALKSCITTLLTGLCDSHGWISCNSSIPLVILKNAYRGYSTLLNNTEETAILEYMKVSPKWNIWNKSSPLSRPKTIDQLDNHNPDMEMNILGSFTLHHKFFNNNNGIRYNMIAKDKKYMNIDNSLAPNHFEYIGNTQSINGTKLQYRNNNGTKIVKPNVNLIDGIACKLDC